MKEKKYTNKVKLSSFATNCASVLLLQNFGMPDLLFTRLIDDSCRLHR